MPIGPFKDFDECVRMMRGKVDDPDAYCASLERGSMAGMRTVLVIPEGVTSSDGRLYDPGLLSWREDVPLMFTDETTENHEGAYQVGRLTNFRRQTFEGETWIVADLTYDSDEDAAEAERLAVEGQIPNVSADVAVIAEQVGIDEDGFPVMEVVSAEIVGVTQVPMPAFAGARILPDASLLPPLVAALRPEMSDDWFENPLLTQPTPLTVTPEGRIFGHLATWGTCHIGFQGECVTPPRSESGYQFFHTGAVEETPVGHITMGTGHASLSDDSRQAAAHYDNTGSCVADICAGEDEFGIWVAGAARPDVDLDALRAASLSGDWRRINGKLELVAALAVNVPGFPIPRTQVAMAASGQMSLVASGIVDRNPDLVAVVQSLVSKVDRLENTLASYLSFDDEEVPVTGEVLPRGHLALVLDRSTSDS